MSYLKNESGKVVSNCEGKFGSNDKVVKYLEVRNILRYKGLKEGVVEINGMLKIVRLVWEGVVEFGVSREYWKVI